MKKSFYNRFDQCSIRKHLFSSVSFALKYENPLFRRTFRRVTYMLYCNKRLSFALYVYGTSVYAFFSYDVNVYIINLTLLLFFYSQPRVSFNSLNTRTNNSLDIVCLFYGVGSGPHRVRLLSAVLFSKYLLS